MGNTGLCVVEWNASAAETSDEGRRVDKFPVPRKCMFPLRAGSCAQMDWNGRERLSVPRRPAFGRSGLRGRLRAASECPGVHQGYCGNRSGKGRKSSRLDAAMCPCKGRPLGFDAKFLLDSPAVATVAVVHQSHQCEAPNPVNGMEADGLGAARCSQW